jgi:hypothetical protein
MKKSILVKKPYKHSLQELFVVPYTSCLTIGGEEARVVNETINLPKDPILLRDMVLAIQGGNIIQGRLEAPPSLLADGEVAEMVGYRVCDDFAEPVQVRAEHPLDPTKGNVVNDVERFKRNQAASLALYVFKKEADFIDFRKTEANPHPPLFDQLVPFAARYIARGYQGNLSFIKGRMIRETWTMVAAMHFLFGGVNQRREDRNTYRVSIECSEEPSALEFILPVISRTEAIQLPLV